MMYLDRMEHDKLYAIHVTHINGPADEQLAAALEEVYEASAKDPNNWLNNPAKKREAREGFLKFIAEWQEENGAFTEEELARARAIVSGVDLRS